MKNKRGIGPLLATVILVAIAVTLGAMVSNYMINKAKEFDPSKIAEESVYCESVTLGYTAYAEDNDVEVINSDGGIEELGLTNTILGPIVLINRGAFSIHKLIITSPGYESLPPRNIIVGNSAGKLDPGKKYAINVQIDTNLDNKKNIKIVPVIFDREKKQHVSCVNRQLIFDYCELYGDVRKDGEGNPLIAEGC